MPDETPIPLTTVFGPYETWLFDGSTTNFAGKDSLLRPGDRLMALAEISSAHPLASTGSSPTTGDEVVAIGGGAGAAVGSELEAVKPTIWKELIDAAKRQPDRPLFLPLVLSSRIDPSRGDVWGKLNARLSSFLSISSAGVFNEVNHIYGAPIAIAPSLNPEFGVRLNSKLPQDCYDISYAEQPRAPQFQPDPEVGKLAKASVGEAPLCLLAVIDDGLAFAHPSLMDRRGQPRMECCWLQSALPAPGGMGTVLFGREHLREDIRKLMQTSNGDEERLYREAGSNSNGHPAIGRVSHASQVLSLAAGAGERDDPEALERIRLIGVELPAALTMDTVGFGKDALVLAAFHYIFDRADRIAAAYGVARLPLVINFSFGFTGGPHDGTDRLEAAIGALIETRGVEITRLVMPAGNHFQSRLHGVITPHSANQAGRFAIPWRIQPNDRTSNYLEIWYPPERLTRPDAPTILWPDGKPARLVDERLSLKPVEQTVWNVKHDGEVVGQVTIDRFRGRRWRMMVILAPTEAAGADWRPCPAGLWRIQVKAPAPGEGEITCRIQRDQTVRSARHYGRQSYFDDPRDVYLGPDDQLLSDDQGAVFVRRFGTLNGLATQPHCTVVAGYRDFAAKGRRLPASYSSAGSVTAPAGAFVDLSAASDVSPARPGIRAAGLRAGSTGRLAGTSAAAPQAARKLALTYVLPKAAEQDLRKPKEESAVVLDPRLGAELIDSIGAD